MQNTLNLHFCRLCYLGLLQ